MEFRVASLPDNIKDPADYMDMFKDEQNLDEKFRREVLEKNSLGWMDWYQRNIMSQYNVTAMPGEKASFADTLDRLGVLLSMTKESSDKKRRFNDMIDSLAASMAVETNVTQVPETIRLQLESELERKTSMNTKWAGSYSLVDETIFRREMGKISEITEKVAPSDDMESFALPQAQAEGKLRGRTSNSQMPFSEPYHDDTTTFTGSRRFRAKNESPKKKPALTPHFSGFQFQSKHDIGWLDDAELMVSQMKAKSYGILRENSVSTWFWI